MTPELYKVLVVDDEAIIVEGLTRVIPWEKYGCRVVATAEDVASGTRSIREHAPDILFTDIRMPDGNGLAMLAGLKAQFPQMQVTVLTGYREFNYAQQAIRLGVTRFLLKPSKMDELIEALEAMTQKLDELRDFSPDPEKEDDGKAAANSFVVRRAVSYIEERCTEKIALSEVADACYVSQWHLSKLLSKYAGQSFYDILNASRIALAKKLLLDPSLRIGDVAERVGYIDTPHFSRVFKKLEGVSANEYRNERL